MPLLPRVEGSDRPAIGYVLLALAAGCVAFDHFFGLSTGWMRDTATIQDLQNRLARLQLDWARWQAEVAGHCPATTGADGGETALDASLGAVVARGLDLVDQFLSDVLDLTSGETAKWFVDFNSSIADLRQQAGTAGRPATPLASGGGSGVPGGA